VVDGRLRDCYNLLGVQRFEVSSDPELPAGEHQARRSSTTTARGWARRNVSLYLDGEQVGEGTVGATAALMFSADDTCDVGKGGRRARRRGLPRPHDFTGEITWVELDVGAAAQDADHQLDHDELLPVAMAKQ
jgi:hypothetical protein